MAENETTQAAEEAKEVTKAESTEETTAAAAESPKETTAAAAEEAKEETKPVAVAAESDDNEEISYHAVEKEGEISAIWEMQGKKHIRTISARSAEGQKILSLFTSEIHETDSPPMAGDASAS